MRQLDWETISNGRFPKSTSYTIEHLVFKSKFAIGRLPIWMLKSIRILIDSSKGASLISPQIAKPAESICKGWNQ